jgi:tetratricopeptide (TPR) repeat protein
MAKWLLAVTAVFSLAFSFNRPLAAQDATPTPSPTEPPPYRIIGDAYAAQGQTDKAVEFYLKALEARSDDAEALAAIQSMLTAPDDDPRLSLAEAYAAAGNHEAALEIYAELLAAEGVDDSVRVAALRSAEQTGLLPALTRQTGQTALTGGANYLLNCLAAGLLVAGLWLLAVLWRRRNERLAPPGRTIVVQPFGNATGNDAFKGMEQGARAALVAWLVNNSAVADGERKTRDGVTLDDIPDTVAAEPFPDVGVLGKFLNWLAARTAPRRARLVIDGTVLARAGRKEVGLALTVRERAGGPVVRAWTEYATATDQHEFEKFAQLAEQGASWVYDPGLTLDRAQAGQLGEINRRLALAREQREAGETAVAQQTIRQAKERARDVERAALESDQGDALASGAGGAGYSNSLLRYRLAQLDDF